MMMMLIIMHEMIMKVMIMMPIMPREVCGDVPKQDCKLVPTSTNCKVPLYIEMIMMMRILRMFL